MTLTRNEARQLRGKWQRELHNAMAEVTEILAKRGSRGIAPSDYTDEDCLMVATEARLRQAAKHHPSAAQELRIYRSWMEAIDTLPAAERAQVWDAIGGYCLHGRGPQLAGKAAEVWQRIKGDLTHERRPQ